MRRILRFVTALHSDHRGIFFIILAYGVFAIGGSLYWAAISILSEGVFRLDAFWIGVIMASIGVVYILTDVPIGVILDYVGYKKGAVISIIFAIIAAVISIIQPSLPFFIVGVVFYALAWNTLTHATSAYILYNVPHNAEGRVFGTFGSIYNLGSFIGTFFIGYVSGWGMINTGVFFLILSLLALFLVLIFVASEKRSFNDNFWQALKSYWQGPSQWKRGLEAMKEFSPVSWVVAFDSFIGYLFSATIWFVIPLSLANFTNPFLPDGLALGIFDFASVIFVAIGGYLADRYSKKKLFLRFLFVEGLVAMVLGFTSSIYLFLLIAFIVAALDDVAGTAIVSMLAEADKNHDKDGTIYGFIGIFTDIGFVIGPLAGGLLLDQFGLRGVFVFLALTLLADWLISAILLRKYQGRPDGTVSRRSDFYLGGAATTRKQNRY